MWELITSLCSVNTDGSVNTPTVASALFFVGLFSGFLHCSFMCGPFALIQFSKRLEGIPAHKMSEFSRLQAASLLPYHLGRIITYTCLGALAGYLAINFKNIFGNWAVAMLIIASALILASVWNIRFKGIKLNLPFLSRSFERMLKPLFSNPTNWRGVLLGMALGLLPCGLLYAALAAAAASASATAGATLLLAFALGTIPSLLVVTFLGSVAQTNLKNGFRFIHKSAGTLTACWLAAFAVINMQ